MSSISSELRVAGRTEESVVDGPGLRYTLYVQGCPHGCPGCHNPQTHDFAGGSVETVGAILAAFAENPLLAGITLSGGEPFCQPGPLAELARGVHALGKTVMTYTGYTLEELSALGDREVDALLAETDLLVDGRFILAEKSLSLPYRGSANQRLVDMRKTREAGQIVLYGT